MLLMYYESILAYYLIAHVNVPSGFFLWLSEIQFSKQMI